MVGPSIDTPTTIKFFCSYGGKILPRYPDGKLRYQGGETRVLSVHCSISFTELLLKLGQICGATVSLRCQLPTEDLDALVSITSDEDLANLIEEYVRVASASPPYSLKIRAFLSLPKKCSSPTSSTSSSISPPQSASSSPKSSFYNIASSTSATRCHRHIPAAPVAFPLCFQKSAAKHITHHAYYAQGNPSHIYLIHNGSNYCQ